MLDDYSIDHQSDRIDERRTREYFEEVKSSYTVGNYRSAVVMLWSVVICDLLFKLEYLATVYTDQVAQEILDEIEAQQLVSPASPTWESMLVERITERTGLLDLADRAQLHHIQQQRHLAAHPVIRDGSHLHRPNKDDTRAMIRSALQSVLTKPPLVSRRIFDQMLADVAQNQNILTADEDLSRYMDSKYFSRFPLSVAEAVFKSLWRLVFLLENPECTANRKINVRVLALLAEKYKVYAARWIDAAQGHFSNISAEPNTIRLFVRFLSSRRDLYSALGEHAKTAADTFAANDEASMLFAFFQANDRDEFFDSLRMRFDEGGGAPLTLAAWEDFRSISNDADWRSIASDLAIHYYAGSRSFDAADSRFAQAIAPYISEFSFDELVQLMVLAGPNGQCSYRGRASRDHLLVEQAISRIDPTFDFSPYGDFRMYL